MTEIGDNSGDLTPDEKRALFFHHFNRIFKQKALADAARKQLGRLRKDAKSDGINLKELDFALRCDALEDEKIVVDEFKGMVRVMKWMGLPVNFQAEMFEDLTPLEDRAYAAGALASAKGKPGSPPHAPGSEPHQAWMRGFHDDGQARVNVLGEALVKSAAITAKAKAGPAKSEAERALDGEPDFPDDTPLTARGWKAAGLRPSRRKKATGSKRAKVKESA